jgi:hypothetical protein
MTIAHRPNTALAHLQQIFLSVILPRVRQHAAVYFRDLKSEEKREEYLAEAVALSWKWYLRLIERGKDRTTYPSTLATFAAKAVRSGRRLVGQETAKDVLSPRAQQLHDFAVFKLPDCSTLWTNPFAEALADNTQSPVPNQVQFRIDFPQWLRTLDARHRRMAEDMAFGHRTLDLADFYGVSPARISELRREFCLDWKRFCGDLPVVEA